MKNYKKNFKIVILAIIFMLVFVFSDSAYAVTNPSLGAADSFSVLAQTAITGTPVNITGDVGMNNFSSNITGLTGLVVVGTIYATDPIPVAPGEAVISSAVQVDASTAYGVTAGLPIEGTPIAVSELNGITRGPGVYDIPGNATLSGGVLTLDGLGTYIFRTDPSSSLTSSGSINFINGARPCDLFWNIGTEANIGGTSFAGTIIASTGIHFTNAGVNLNGRALAVGADVTLNVNGSISGPTCPSLPPPPTTATLTLVKTITNDNGGTRTVADFALTATGATSISGISGTAGVTNATLNTGVYTLSEINHPDYTQGIWSCTNSIVVNASSQITLSSGNVTTCTINNNDIPPTIVVNKIVVNNNNGTKLYSDFSLKLDGAVVLHGVANTSTIGLHTVSEIPDAGYTSVIGGDCATDGTITLALGDIKTCTITNDDIYHSSGGGGSYTSPVPPLIDVVKIPNPLTLPGGPGLVTYTYTLKNIGTVPVSNIIMVDDKCSSVNFISGDIDNDAKLDVNETWTYRCSATLSKTTTNIVTTTGWANGISATDIASATVVVGASIIPPLINVTKIPSPLSLVSAGNVIYTYKVTNPGTVPLSNVNITDDKCTGLPGRVLGHPGDLNKNNLLENNEEWTFTCKSRITKTTTNTATASGTANNLTAKDYAFATVVVSFPGLPKTGFSPEEKITPWFNLMFSKIFNIFLK